MTIDTITSPSKSKIYSRNTLGLGFALISLIIPVAQVRADDAASSEHKAAAYMGAGSCANQTCHGAVSPRNSTSVLQNEYTTWQKHDKHAQAWQILTNADSKKIGANMGMASPEKEPLCLKCHSTYIKESSRKSSNFTEQDGVSCESCHGAAENFLGSHTANDATHKGNIEKGMLEVVSLGKRADLCLSCHLGTDDQTVNHKLIGSGHPRLTFELDTFSLRQPAHWMVDDDYKKRKGEGYSSSRAWLIGQVKRSQGMVSALLSEKRSKDGAWPELTMFTCYSCHHSLSENQWKKRDYAGRPGELRVNLSSLLITQQALQVLSPDLSTEIKKKIDGVHANFKEGKTDDIKALHGLLEKALAKVEGGASADQLKKVLGSLAAFGATNASQQYEVAEQVAMGLAAIIAEISPDGKLYKNEITAVFTALKDPKEFKAEDFNSACASFAKK